MLQKLLPISIVLLFPLGVAERAKANVPNYSAISHYCYMVDNNGEVLDLDHLCIRHEPEVLERAEVSDAIPLAGQVCSDFASWGEAQYHFEAGTAPRRLDGDNDGIACEDLRRMTLSGGSAVFTNRNTRGDSIEIMRISPTSHYLRVNLAGYTFTSRFFENQSDARDHMDTYYSALI
ncbi:MAG: excalibur calcium-binding domain-containing protein [Cyanobacteria bacterium J06638_6]